MVIDRRVAWDELAETIEQVLQPEHGANALVEGVFVENQAGVPRGSGCGVAWHATASRPRLFHASRRLSRHGAPTAPQIAHFGSELGCRDAVVGDDRVGAAPARVAARLLGDDGARRVRRPPGALHDALDLRGLAA